MAYETDDLVGFQDLVRELRETESRRSTIRDTPIITGIHRPLGGILQLSRGRTDDSRGCPLRPAPRRS